MADADDMLIGEAEDAGISTSRFAAALWWRTTDAQEQPDQPGRRQAPPLLAAAPPIRLNWPRTVLGDTLV
jgi:hypothetical protein